MSTICKLIELYDAAHYTPPRYTLWSDVVPGGYIKHTNLSIKSNKLKTTKKNKRTHKNV
jgi:hypothetical protein